MCLTSLLALDACAPAVLRAPMTNRAEDSSQAPETIRTLRADQQFAELPIASVAQRARGMRPEQPFNILALSGGGADGAFGAGALIGLAQAGTRPAFSVVTGVSAGALIAPYAFLGPEWDHQLADAYTSGRAEHLLQPRGLGVVLWFECLSRLAAQALGRALPHRCACSGRGPRGGFGPTALGCHHQCRHGRDGDMGSRVHCHEWWSARQSASPRRFGRISQRPGIVSTGDHSRSGARAAVR